MYNHLTLQMYDLTLTASTAMPATWGKPMKTRDINHAAQLALPGDTITVHNGTYREWINP